MREDVVIRAPQTRENVTSRAPQTRDNANIRAPQPRDNASNRAPQTRENVISRAPLHRESLANSASRPSEREREFRADDVRAQPPSQEPRRRELLPSKNSGDVAVSGAPHPRSVLISQAPGAARPAAMSGAPKLREPIASAAPQPRDSADRPLPSRRARHPSHKLAAAVYCEIDGMAVDIEPLELSTAGLFVETPAPLPVDTEVDIFLRIGEMRIEASGHVVQSISCDNAVAQRRTPGYGLLFTHMDERCRAELRRGIEALVIGRARPPEPPAHVAVPPAPAPTACKLIPPEEVALLEKLRAELQALGDKTPWAMLGISQGADPAQAKAAYFQASKRYHPHLYARYAAPEIKSLVTELFIAHKRAYTTLLKSAKASRVGRQSAPADRR